METLMMMALDFREAADERRILPEAVSVPEGQTRIARRFNAGIEVRDEKVPKGRLMLRPFSTVPSGLDNLSCCPGVETPGYCQSSLRDDGLEILMALGLETTVG
jgi:hypothetical protein